MELMEALIPLKLRWSALWSILPVPTTSRFLDLACRSGLLHVNIGIESINPDTLNGMNKRFNKLPRYGEMLANLRRRGNQLLVEFHLRLDGETEGAFRANRIFFTNTRCRSPIFNILHAGQGHAASRPAAKRIADHQQP